METALSGPRQCSNLLQKFHHRHLDPVFANLAVLQSVDMNLGPVNALISRTLARERSLMGRNRGTSFDDFVAAGDEIFFRDHNVRESAIHHPANLLETFQAGRQGGPEVVRETRIKEVGNSVHVVIILENAREFSDGLFVPFFLHKHAFLELKVSYEEYVALLVRPKIRLRRFPRWFFVARQM